MGVRSVRDLLDAWYRGEKGVKEIEVEGEGKCRISRLW
jgi:hypothetical protein